MLKTAWNLFKKNAIFFGMLTVLVVICYINSVNNVFISDDFPSIVDNKSIGQLSYVFGHPVAFGKNILIYMILKMFGLVPAPYRLLNIFFHLGNVWFIFILVYLLTKQKIAAFVSAALFAVHPLLVESVAWISGGGYSQYTFFFLPSLIFYILFDKKKNNSYYYLSFIFFIISLISNRSAVALPAILFAYDLSVEKASKKWKYYLPFFMLSVVWLYLFIGPLRDRVTTLQGKFYQPEGYDNPLTQIPTALYSYFELIFVPIWLTFYHTELLFSPLKFMGAIVITLSYFGALLYTYLKKKEYFFWLSIFVIPLLPTLTPLRIAWTVAERYAYLSLLGIVVPVVLIGMNFYHKEKYTLIVTLLFTVIVTLLTIRTIVRNIDWKTDENLWTATGKLSPSSPWNHNNLGDLYARQGRFTQSIAEFRRAIELLPNYADAYHNMGNTYRDMGQIDNALKNYEMAVKYNPGLWQSYLNIGSIYFDKANYKEAANYTIKAINLVPGNSPLYSNLAVIYYRMGNKEEARRYFMKAIEIDPNNEKARFGLMQLN